MKRIIDIAVQTKDGEPETARTFEHFFDVDLHVNTLKVSLSYLDACKLATQLLVAANHGTPGIVKDVVTEDLREVRRELQEQLIELTKDDMEDEPLYGGEAGPRIDVTRDWKSED